MKKSLKLIKPFYLFKKLPLSTRDEDARLWRIVLDKALEDYFCEDPSVIDESRTLHQEVSAWLGSEDHFLICGYSSLDPQKVLKVFQYFKKRLASE